MKTRAKKDVRKVAVVLRLSYGSGRDLLYGISCYAKKHCRWRFHIINFTDDATLDEIRRAEDEGIDGIIANGVDNESIARFLSKSRTPLTVIGARSPGLRRRRENIAFVRNDDVAIGRYGAAYLSSLGHFRTYGFVARSHGTFHYVSQLREEGFRSHFAGKAAYVRTYATDTSVERGSFADISPMAAWLDALPKPAAVMAVDDLRATHALEAAAVAGIKVPKDLAVIGVDNDELLCEMTEPPLTSIAPDHVRLGELAAGTLDRLMRVAPLKHTFTLRSTAKTLAERQSAKSVTPSVHLVERATAYIRRNATKGIGAEDVIRHLGVSRRLADLRFRQLTGETILSAILRIRLAEVKRRLKDTDTPIAKITVACGFKGENYAKKLFRSRFGTSMTEFRRKCRM